MKENKGFQSYAYIMADMIRSIPISFSVIFICKLCLALAPSFIMILSTNMFNAAMDMLNGSATYKDILPYVLLYLGVYLVLDQISMFSNVAIHKRLYEFCNTKYKVLLAKKASRLPMSAFDEDRNKDEQRKAMECIEDKAIPASFQQILELFFSIFSIVSVVIILVRYSVFFLPIALFSVLPYFVIRKIRGKEFYHIRNRQVKQERMKDYLWTLFSDKQCMKEIHTMGHGTYLLGKWNRVNSEVNEEIWSYNRKEQGYNLLCEIIRIAGYFISVALALVLTLQGKISIGTLGACILAFQTVQNQMSEALGRMAEISKLLLFTKNYCLFLNLEEEVEGSHEIEKLEKIAVRNLVYRYPNAEKNALNDFSMVLRKGQKIALVGENGSGKTTFVKCLLGLYQAQKGSVTYDSWDVKEIKRPSARFGVVEQDVIKYYFTIREALLLGNVQTYTEQEAAKALCEVGLDSLTKEKDFLDKQLGAEFGGIELSGGEWQRLALARCILKKPEFLILDEPTSALDPLCENELLLKMLSLAEHSTAFIITHRVGICKNVDCVVVLKNGRIAEMGSHEELMLKDGEYRRLYDMQRKWYV